MMHKYKLHKANAKQRGVEFTLSYEQWLSVWGDELKDMGRNKGQKVMARTRDEGGYTIGNVRIATVAENSHDRAVVYRVSKSQIPTKPLDYRKSLPREECFLTKRHDVFAEYVEEDE